MAEMYWYLSVEKQLTFWMWALVQVIPLQQPHFLTVTGRWAIEVADEYPHAYVTGIDLAPIQPHFIPINCEFRVANLTEDLEDFYDGYYDLVHSRYKYNGCTTANL
jgi:hypothetical protein